ncbi:MAG: FAD-dependent oxidoreductase [Saprospiraceae bacterium]
MIKQYDDIVVGAGLAGCLMAFSLLQRHRKVMMIDIDQESSSSAIAAGIINPITGKNYIKSWNIDLFLPVALQIYREVENFFNIQIIHKKNLIRTLPNASSDNIWESRKLDIEYADYVVKNADIESFKDEVNLQGNLAEISQSYRIDIGLYISTVKQYMMNQGDFLEENVMYENIAVGDKEVTYKQIKSQNLIFCEGYKGIQNIFFPDPGFSPTVGKASYIKMTKSNITKMVKDDVFLVPFGKDIFWIGGGYLNIPSEITERMEDTEVPTKNISKVVKRDYELIEEKSAIRPTTIVRKPFVLQHQNYSNLYYINGLGTKGSSVGPFYAQLLVNYITGISTEFPQV